MIISIQQPEYFPWLGYFDKLLSVDKVVFLDNVQFKKRYFENRNKIRTYQGWTWIVTPVLTKGRFKQKIMDVEIDNSQTWQKKIISTLTLNYKKSPYWKKSGEKLCELISKPYTRLVDLNLSIILFFMDKLNIQKDYCLASTLDTKDSSSQLIIEICQKMNAKIYFSGKDGKQYLDEKEFINNDIKIIYQNFKHPEYIQFHGNFIPNMSIVDLYFNHGIKGVDIIKENNSKVFH